MRTIMFPGEGSVAKGMGKRLFEEFPELVQRASGILGYDLQKLCLSDPDRKLDLTQYAQPAVYVVNALGYLKRQANTAVDFLIGHSLGEYNALHAAGVFDFETGLRLVIKRAELMAGISCGMMMTVTGLTSERLRQRLDQGGYCQVEIANFNSFIRHVISGPAEDVKRAAEEFDRSRVRVVPMFVRAPLHSSHMRVAARQFYEFLQEHRFAPPNIPVIANVDARPYDHQGVAGILSRQIDSPVLWTDSILSLDRAGVMEFEEVGGFMLGKLTKEIRAMKRAGAGETGSRCEEPALQLGSAEFRKDFGVDYAYMSGSMYRGIASKELVVRMGKAGMVGFLGTGGMSPGEIEENVRYICEQLNDGEPYGLNLLHNRYDPHAERSMVQLFLQTGVRFVEASGFEEVTSALVYYRVKGLTRDGDGRIKEKHSVVAKVSSLAVAERFMRPAPKLLLAELVATGLITGEEALLGEQVPVSFDICMEADSGGHTESGVALVLLPAAQQMKKEIEEEYAYGKSIRVGLAGGIGTPHAAACAFAMGADFILTGSINQCTVEAGTSDAVKDLLQDMKVQDTGYAPAGDKFESGGKVQVLCKGLLFARRANHLLALYNRYDSLEEIPGDILEVLERDYFKKPLDLLWRDTRQALVNQRRFAEVEKAENNPRSKMALIFRKYFAYSSRLAFEGGDSDRTNFQVHTGPALGAFNQYVKGTGKENWRNRHVDEIGCLIMREAAQLLKMRF